jgi:hypothetical protein
MKSIARSLVIMLVALIAVPVLAVSVTLTTAVQLLATTALILGGTQHSLGADDDQAYIPGYLDWAANGFINPGYRPTPTPSPINTVAVVYPAQFAPVTGTTTFDDSVENGVANLGSCLDANSAGCVHNGNFDSPPLPGPGEHFAIFGYSQSAVVASLVKNQLIEDHPAVLDGTNFFLISNPMRPNGGILARDYEGFTIPLIGITFYGPTENSCPQPCDPDDIVYPTVDVAQQYDFLGGDAPMRPLNFLAMANSIAAYQQLHGAVQNHDLDEGGLIDQGQYGDTHYYMIAADTLPILQPLVTAGVPAPALALPDAILRVWIEDAYDRNSSPGEHVKFNYIPIGNPISLIGNTLGAIPVGIDDTVDGFAGLRPLGTQPAGPFGVGGPPAQLTPNPAPAAAPQLKVVPEQTTTPGDNKLAKDQVDASKLGNDTVSPNAGNSDAIKPSLPFEKWRQTSVNNPVHRPFGIRPGEGPISRIVKALTGQKDKDTESNSEPATKDAAA